MPWHFAVPADRAAPVTVAVVPLEEADTALAKLAFTILLIVSVGGFAYLIARRVKVLRAAMPLDRFDRPWERIKGVLVYYIGQKRILDPW